MNRILTRLSNPGTAMMLIFLIWSILDNFIHFRHGSAVALILVVIAIIVILVEGRRAR
jgi:ABC-type sugar transport system permease subunit